MRSLLFFVVCVGVVALAGCAGAERSGQERTSAVALTACQITAPGTVESIAGQCGVVTVYEDRAAQRGRTIALHVTVIPAIDRTPAEDAVFFLAGGPGQAASESYPLLASAFEQINQQRAIVLVDQRGTGDSHPLRCPAPDSGDAALTGARLTAWLTTCQSQLDADPRLYTTTSAVEDLDQVRAALGYDMVTLYGVSYGTRVALTYLQRYPDHARAVILDGVVPQDVALGMTAARDAQRALDMIFTRCEADTACQAAFPDARSAFADLVARRTQQPAKLRLAHPITGVPTDMTFDGDTLATSVRLLSYAPETAALLPLLFHTAAQGDEQVLAAQALMVGDQLGASISNGLNLSVVCAEDEPFIDSEQAHAANGGTYLGDRIVAYLHEACAVWPHGTVPPAFKQPVESRVPVLLLSGEADPVTPPEYAARAARTLPNSLQVIAPGQGHNVVMRGCLPRVAADFVARASVAGLDTACVNDIQPMSFFIRFTGPQP